MDSMNYSQPPYSKRYPELLTLYKDEPAVAKNNHLTHNISYLGRWVDLLDHLTFDIVDSHSNIIADQEKGPISPKDKIVKGNPGITNYQQYNYLVTGEGLKEGFKNIPVSKIGIQQDQYRMNFKNSAINK